MRLPQCPENENLVVSECLYIITEKFTSMLLLVAIIRNLAASRYSRTTRKSILNENECIDKVVLDMHITFLNFS